MSSVFLSRPQNTSQYLGNEDTIFPLEAKKLAYAICFIVMIVWQNQLPLKLQSASSNLNFFSGLLLYICWQESLLSMNSELEKCNRLKKVVSSHIISEDYLLQQSLGEYLNLAECWSKMPDFSSSPHQSCTYL